MKETSINPADLSWGKSRKLSRRYDGQNVAPEFFGQRPDHTLETAAGIRDGKPRLTK